MPNLSSLTTNFFATPNEGFTTTTSAPVDSSTATVVPFNSVSGLTNGSIFTGLIDPGNAKERAFTGVVDTGGSQITSVKFTTGTNATHTTGATIVDYVTGTHFGAMTKGILISHDQDGTLKAGAVDATAVLADSIVTKDKLSTALGLEHDTGWNLSYAGTTVPAPNTITNNGNRSYDLVFNSTDLTDTLSAGMRLRLNRTVSAPTQCADLESGSSQYFSKTSPNKLTFADDFTCMGWVKLESYVAGGIIARRNADTEGWSLSVNASGQVLAGAYRIAANNSVTASYQSLPLNKWVHVAASVDLSGTSVLIYVDGVLVPSLTTITGTITALVQGTTALVVGAEKSAGTNPFDGKIAQTAVFSSVLSASTIRSYMSQTLSGSETNIASAYSLSNSIVDLNATTPNDLTAQGSALATNVDSPFGNYLGATLEYAIITKTAFSTNTTVTVQIPEGCAIPTSGGVSAVAYSTQASPYGWPGISNIIGYAQVPANFAGTTNAGNGDDVLGLTTTVTPPANARLRFIVTGKGIQSSAGAGQTVAVRVTEGTTELASVNQQITTNGYNMNPTVISVPHYPTSGAHTYKVNLLQSAAGTQTLVATATAPASLSVEVVGGL